MNKFSKNRRRLMITGAIAGLGGYAYHRVLRYPRMGFEPSPLAQLSKTDFGVITYADAISLPSLKSATIEREQFRLRAIAPEPSIRVEAHKGKFQISVNNIAQNAAIEVRGDGARKIDEQQIGITRTVFIDAAESQTLDISWRLPNEDGFDFAVIGDTGGNTEMEWCLRRAKELGAQFLLHLGDFNYGNEDYQRAINYFHNAPLPCYISIGNHDFNDSGLVYQHFRQHLGRFNHHFTIAGTRFVNFDTAADFFPVHGGMRGDFFEQLQREQTTSQLFFTHRPLRDPRPGEDHNVGSVNGVSWLSEAIDLAGGGPLLTGHVHHSAELDINGIEQYSIGEGLGYEDILLQRQVAQLQIGRVERGKRPQFSWQPLNMPWSAHRSHTHIKKLKLDADHLIDWYYNTIG